MITVYVGSDSSPRAKPAERVLEHSIRKHCSDAVQIHWMRAGKKPWDWGLRVGVDKRTHTPFTPFRFAIPWVHVGRKVIYLDVDMMVLGDLAELWSMPVPPTQPWLCSVPQEYRGKMKHKTEVSVINVAALRQSLWYPPLHKIQEHAYTASQMASLMRHHQALDESIPIEWNCLDGQGFVPGKTKLVHFTAMGTQPWKPYPERFDYSKPHPCPEVVELWQQYLKEADDVHSS